MNYIVNVPMEVTREDIVNLFSYERNGFDYWATVTVKHLSDGKVPYEELITKDLENGKSVHVYDEIEKVFHSITLAGVLDGFRLNAINYPDNKEIKDATTADHILQFAVYGEVKYE